MSEIESISCPHCGQVFTVAPGQMAQYLGQTINCTRCNQPFTVGVATQRPGAVPPAVPSYHSGMNEGPQSTSGVAIAALVLGIVSFVIPVVGSIAAVTCGIVGIVKTGPGKLGGRGLAIAGLSLGGFTLLTMPCLIGLFLPALNRARSATAEVKCASNLRQIGLACIMYSNQQRDGAFPDTLDKLVAAGQLPPSVFVCPSSNDTASRAATPNLIAIDLANGGHDSYIYVGAGLKNTVLSDTVLAYEPITNHRNGANILFGDCHVEFVRSAQAQQMINDVNAGKNPPSSQAFPLSHGWRKN